jgi:murein L,D-transpeptidase YcbB/YkuD
MVRGPGPGNPLGRVKFVFPNPHGIYLHDTNAPSRLQWENRALSHGCIRLEDPAGLAGEVLALEGWDSTRVASHFTGPWVTEPVDLTSPLPVHLVYFTAEADANGDVRRVEDVYGWDRPLARALGYSDEELESARAAVRPRGASAE